MAIAAVTAIVVGVVAPGASADPGFSPVMGSGSTYAALAIQDWTAAASTFGLSVNYQPNGSPQGLNDYGASTTTFAGSEAEFSELSVNGSNANPARGFQYTPDVAGAVAMMYNVPDQAGRSVTYLHLSPTTIDRIFTGLISNWNDPQISADNAGLVLPNHPITVVYRAGESGTTALFYDFVSHTDPGDFTNWTRRTGFPNELTSPTGQRIIAVDQIPGANPYPLSVGQQGSDTQAQFIADTPFTIGYDEFGYAKVHHDSVAWVKNAAGQSTQPYALNIAAALKGAHLRPDLSQDLTGVYTNPDPLTYPISAYSYFVAQCLPGSGRATCAGGYANAGQGATMAKFMRYVGCGGQGDMAAIGYSPLPVNLSQEVANSVARITGQPPEQLNAANCANPQFVGSLGAGATPPPDPLAGIKPGSLGPSTSGGTSTAAAAPTAAGPAAAAATGAGTGLTANARAVGGLKGQGAGVFRSASPAAYAHPAGSGGSIIPLLMFVAVVALPAVALGARRRRRRSVE